MNFIVAVSQNFGIGKNNNLLFNLPLDLKFFKEKTLNKVVIMGEKTYLSLPKRPLVNRTNVVMTLNKDFKAEGAYVVNSVDQLLKFVSNYSPDDVFVCGGGMIYKLLLPYCKKGYVTKVNSTVDADTFFPNLDNDPQWKLTKKGNIQQQNGLNFSFDEYQRIQD